MVRSFLFSILFCLLTFSVKSAGVSTNIDYKTVQQVTLNTGYQQSIELLQNRQLDSIKKKQTKIQELVGFLSTYKGAMQLTYQNVKGFGKESGIYKSIVTRTARIIVKSGTASKAVMNTSFSGKAICAIKIAELLQEAIDLGNVFYDIVTNGTVVNPLKKEDNKSKPDKINLLNPKERLRLAMSVNKELAKIERTLCMVEYYCKHNSVMELIKQIDPKTYRTLVYSKVLTNRLINKWNQLKD